MFPNFQLQNKRSLTFNNVEDVIRTFNFVFNKFMTYYFSVF